VRKISSIGVVTTLAGHPTTKGTADGQGTSATFGLTQNIAVDTNLNVYVGDYSNNNVRMITSSGFVTTMAGSKSGTSGSADGQGTAAGFNTPIQIAVDSNAYVYISDYLNHKVRKISPSSMVSTLAGNGAASTVNGVATLAGIPYPMGLVVDVRGNVYVATQSGGYTIRLITSSGSVSTFAGSGSSSASASDGFGTTAVLDFSTSFQLAIDTSSNIYLGSTNYIRKMTSSGAVTTVFSRPAATFYFGVAVDTSSNLYASEYGSGLVYKISQAGGSGRTTRNRSFICHLFVTNH